MVTNIGNAWCTTEEENYLTFVVNDLACFSREKSFNKVLIFPSLPSRFRFLTHKLVEKWPELKSCSIGLGSSRRTVVYFKEKARKTHAPMSTPQKTDQRPSCCGEGRGTTGEVQHGRPKDSPTSSHRPTQALYTPGAFRKHRRNSGSQGEKAIIDLPGSDENTLLDYDTRTGPSEKPMQVYKPNLDNQSDCKQMSKDNETQIASLPDNDNNLEKKLNNLGLSAPVETSAVENKVPEYNKKENIKSVTNNIAVTDCAINEDENRPENNETVVDSGNVEKVDAGKKSSPKDIVEAESTEQEVEAPSKSKRKSKKAEKAKKREERLKKKQVREKSSKKRDGEVETIKEDNDDFGKKKSSKDKIQEEKVLKRMIDEQAKDSLSEDMSVQENEHCITSPPGECALEDEDWETAWDDDGKCLDDDVLAELEEHLDTRDVETVQPQFDYLSFKPNDIILENGVFDHVVEIYDFCPQFKTHDLINALSNFQQQNFQIHWVDDTHALAVFSNHRAAHQAIEQTSSPMMKIRPLCEGTQESKLKARRHVDILQPYKERPKTTKLVANRLVAGALGLRSKMSREERQLEREKIKAERERKQNKEKQKKDLWESDDL